MTAKAIESFQKQARSGDVLLYAGRHGIDFIDDIGRLMGSEITPDGDWMTEYRLYDDGDEMGPHTLEKCDKLWRQINGMPPYTKPKQKGFSIEGVIPENGIQTMDTGGRRVMDDIQLDGVVVVSRPAYQESVARAVYKALGVTMPSDFRKGLKASIKNKLRTQQDRTDYYDQYYTLQSALDDEIRGVMNSESAEKEDMLRTLFEEYRDLMVELIMKSETVFLDTSADSGTAPVHRALDVHRYAIKRLEAGRDLLVKVLTEHGLRGPQVTIGQGA